MKNSRLISFEILYDVLYNDAYSNIAIDKALSNYNGKDKAFITSLVYGVLERKITLEYIINQYLNSKAKPKVMLVLMLGTYQLYFMQKVPSHAAINECVELCKNVGAGYYKGLVNAVLHKIDKNKIDIDSIDDLSVKYSCPTHLINMWTKMYGEDVTLKILSSLNNRPPVYAVPNTLFVDADELLYELNNCGIEGEVVNSLVKITSNFDLNNCKPFDDGLFYIEDLSSYTCACKLGANDYDTVIDVCSAPGGKAFTIAQHMHNTGVIHAYDLHNHRVKLIQSGADRLGIKNIVADVNDACVFNKNIDLADKIICDVPCSGFGIMRRKPEIRYKDLDSIKGLYDIQYKILSTSSKYLKSGGTLMYSTCTLNKKENEQIVEKFLQNNPEFSLIDMQTFIPNEDSGDGFFFAKLEKLKNE